MELKHLRELAGLTESKSEKYEAAKTQLQAEALTAAKKAGFSPKVKSPTDGFHTQVSYSSFEETLKVAGLLANYLETDGWALGKGDDLSPTWIKKVDGLKGMFKIMISAKGSTPYNYIYFEEL